MKKIIIDKYEINTTKLNKKILIISDIHYSSKKDKVVLDKVLDKIKNSTYDYILIPGDFVNNARIEDEDIFINFIELLSNMAPVIISIGNHELYYFKGKEKEFFFNKKYFDSLNKIENIYVLNNDSYIDENIYVYGLTLSYDYYLRYDDREDIDEFIHSINKIKDNNSNKQRFILIHSPVCLINKSKYNKSNSKLKFIYDKLTNFDYFITGHMHNGCILPGVNEIWYSSKGLISPKKKLFPENTRNTLNNIDDKLLVNGPLTTFHGNKGIFTKMNFLFPINVSLFIFDNGNNSFKLENNYKSID